MKNVTQMNESEAIENIKNSNNMMWLSLNFAGESAHKNRPAVLEAINAQKAIVASK